MIAVHPFTGRARLAVLTLVLLGFTPFRAAAETILLRNETSIPLMVQATVVIRGAARHERPNLLQPGGAARLTLPGTKLLTIYNARIPSQILWRETLPGSTEDAAFAIKAEPGTSKLKLEPIKTLAAAAKPPER